MNAKIEQTKRLGTVQLVTALWSIIFIFSIFSGYFLLFKNNIFLAVVIGAILAFSAWNMARFIGGQEKGLAKHKPLFVMLLLISAVGIMNFLMLNFEGRQIFSEAISASEDRYTELASRAESKLTAEGISGRIKTVQSLTESLVSEINNPLNCGQGPEARSIMQRLGQELPGFVPLSNPSRDCSRNAEVIADYKKKISGLVDRAPWNNGDLSAVVRRANESKSQLQKLEAVASTSFAYNLMLNVSPQLQEIGVRYRGDFERLARHASTKDISPRLNLKSVESLGEWSQLINLIVDRWNRPTTWLYIILAIFFDYFMIYLFDLVRQNRLRRTPSVSGASIGRGF